eukprot:11764814-Heterocapsa_arctica.AAC.1
MKRVHGKAPIRRKEERKAGTGGRQAWFHGPKVGIHGAHFFEDREEGGWKCRGCKRHSSTHAGWRHMVRTPCGTRAPASRVRWKASFDRRLWGRIMARKEAAGDDSANHEAVSMEDGKWICKICGKVAIRPTDMGG